jgi:hypothetical protein
MEESAAGAPVAASAPEPVQESPAVPVAAAQPAIEPQAPVNADVEEPATPPEAAAPLPKQGDLLSHAPRPVTPSGEATPGDGHPPRDAAQG